MLTPSQQSAVDAPIKDIIVSAGAGSGKTTVLTTRIIESIAAGEDIRKYLVVTFTTESAADLKRKLSEKLESLSIKHPDSSHYRKQLYALPAASIGTIDSFCLLHVKQNAAELGLVKGIGVGDKAFCDTLLNSSADSLISELCEEDDSDIELLLGNFASYKDDNGLIETAFKLYESLRKYPFYQSWLEKTVNDHQEQTKLFLGKGFFATYHGGYVKERLERWLKNLRALFTEVEKGQETARDEEFCKSVGKELSALEQGFANDYDSFCKAVTNYKVPACSRMSPGVTAAYKDYKAEADKRGAWVRTSEQLEKEYVLTGKVLAALSRFMLRLDEKYTAAKTERGIIDFADVEQLFLKLLITVNEKGEEEKTPLCKSLSQSFTQVFMDEYQDVSPLQDKIFSAIGEGKRFMVGDVKQSIYGFRDAYPDIFMGYRDSFAPVAAEDSKTACVFLKENFRCDLNIVGFCNHLFDRVFTLQSADTDYKKERLVFAKDNTDTYTTALNIMEHGDAEKEAAAIGEEIVRLISTGEAEPKHIAVIARKKRSIAPLINALEARGIPCNTEKTEDKLLKQPEVLLAISLLRIIDNPTDDISLAALLRSPIFRFTAEELLIIRRAGGGSCYYHNLQTLAEKDSETTLGKKCAAFIQRISLYRTKALLLPIDALVWYLYEDTNIWIYAPEGREARYRDNLLLFYEIARGLETDSYKGLPVFMDYISKLEEGENSPDAATAKAENSVSVMVMHGSKGLEFPFVFIADTVTTISKKHRKQSLAVNYRAGISVKLADQKEAWKASTLLRDVELEVQDGRGVAEEYRLLYVAFTRAKRRLYISCALPDTVETYLGKAKEQPAKLCDLFLGTLLTQPHSSFKTTVINGEEDIPVTVLAGALARREAAVTALPEGVSKHFPVAERVGAKYFVSQVKRTEQGAFAADTDKEITARKPIFAAENSTATGALRGTANHAFLQFANFAAAEKDVEKEAERLLSLGYISAQTKSLLNVPALERFFASGIYAQIKQSMAVYREKRFTTRLPAALFDAEGEDVLVQGVIDCFFRNADGTYTLVDYKTDYVKAGEERFLAEKYNTQLYLYSLYIEKATGAKVSGAYIYSLSLDKAIPCDIKYS